MYKTIYITEGDTNYMLRYDNLYRCVLIFRMDKGDSKNMFTFLKTMGPHGRWDV